MEERRLRTDEQSPSGLAYEALMASRLRRFAGSGPHHWLDE